LTKLSTYYDGGFIKKSLFSRQYWKFSSYTSADRAPDFFPCIHGHSETGPPNAGLIEAGAADLCEQASQHFCVDNGFASCYNKRTSKGVFCATQMIKLLAGE